MELKHNMMSSTMVLIFQRDFLVTFAGIILNSTRSKSRHVEDFLKDILFPARYHFLSILKIWQVPHDSSVLYTGQGNGMTWEAIAWGNIQKKMNANIKTQ